MNNKGFTIAHMLGTLVLSSIILLTLTRVYTFILNVEQETVLNTRLLNESAIIINDFQREFDTVIPYECIESAGNYTCNGHSNSFTIEVIDNSPTFTLKLNGQQLNSSIKMTSADFYPSFCSNCTDNGIYILEFGLSRASSFDEDEILSTVFRASFRVIE